MKYTRTPLSRYHWREFQAFADAEIASGGPDPQVCLTARATEPYEDREAARMAGLFVSAYTCGGGTALWMTDHRGEDLQSFLVEHTEGIPTRRERRVIWSTNKRKMTLNIESWIDFAEKLPQHRSLSYPELYDTIHKEVLYFGRYATMKVIEVLYDRHLIDNTQSDIRPRGAKFPRRTLGLLFPEHAHRLTSSYNDEDTIQLVNRCAAAVKDRSGIETWFDLETLLCNYRQSLNGKYPGRSHDRELAHWLRAEEYWGDSLLNWFPFYRLRKQMFQSEYLGELGDPPWYAARDDLEDALVQRHREALDGL